MTSQSEVAAETWVEGDTNALIAIASTTRLIIL
jgi:hypothetical protein